jgi:hypothetical protein
MFTVINTCSTSDVVIKKSGGAGITIPMGSNVATALYATADYIRITGNTSY